LKGLLSVLHNELEIPGRRVHDLSSKYV